MTDPWHQPHDELAEKVVLGQMLSSSVAAETALRMLVSRDLYHPAHCLVFETVGELADARRPTDLASVHSELLNNGRLSRAGGAAFLFNLVHENAGTPAQVAYHCNQIAEMAMRRDLIASGQRIAQRAAGTNGETGAELLGYANDQLAGVRSGTGEEGTDDGLDGERLDAPPPDSDWLIPGLLERGDRLMLTGSEGYGKSTLTRQIAICAAAGIDPFDEKRTHDPVRVMIVDCENSESLSRRAYQPLLRAARDVGRPVDDRFRLYLQPSGLDLSQRGGSGYLLRRVAAFRPDLLVIGPLYRLHYGDPSDERDARRIAGTLDQVREAADCGLILEAHSPHRGQTGKRTLRPVGSSLWMRWPEFGYGLEPDEDDPTAWLFRVCKFTAWRGARDIRRWPKKLRSGGTSTPWPWVCDDETETQW